MYLINVFNLNVFKHSYAHIITRNVVLIRLDLGKVKGIIWARYFNWSNTHKLTGQKYPP